MTEAQADTLLIAIADLIFLAKVVGLGVAILVGQSLIMAGIKGRNSEMI